MASKTMTSTHVTETGYLSLECSVCACAVCCRASRKCVERDNVSASTVVRAHMCSAQINAKVIIW